MTAAVGKLWARFHGRPETAAVLREIGDVPGLPKSVAAVGLFQGIVDRDGVRVRVSSNATDGPWLVSDGAGTRLWVVGRTASAFAPLRPHEGKRFAGIFYFPTRSSGKYDRHANFLHFWGDGGRLPRSRWSEVWPILRRVHTRAFALAGGAYRVEPRGIVN